MVRSAALPSGRGRRTRRTGIALLSVSCLVVGTGGAAGAAVDRFTDTFVDVTVRGQSISTDVDGCTEAVLFVDASEHFVTYEQFCFDTGAGVYGSADPTTFDVAADGSSAHVVATLELFAGETGEPAGVLVLDNTWTASGKAARIKGHFTDHQPGATRFSLRQNGLRTPATVTGTVPLDEGSIETMTTTVVVRTRV